MFFGCKKIIKLCILLVVELKIKNLWIFKTNRNVRGKNL